MNLNCSLLVWCEPAFWQGLIYTWPSLTECAASSLLTFSMQTNWYYCKIIWHVWTGAHFCFCHGKLQNIGISLQHNLRLSAVENRWPHQCITLKQHQLCTVKCLNLSFFFFTNNLWLNAISYFFNCDSECQWRHKTACSSGCSPVVVFVILILILIRDKTPSELPSIRNILKSHMCPSL